MPEEIENPWCVYRGHLGLRGFGKIERESKNSVYIRYSEGQFYPPKCWDSNYVKRFPTLTEAVEHYIKKRPGVDIRTRDETDDGIRQRARRSFPEYFRKPSQ